MNVSNITQSTLKRTSPGNQIFVTYTGLYECSFISNTGWDDYMAVNSSDDDFSSD